MKQKYLWIAAALTVALSACGGQPVRESPEAASPSPVLTPALSATAAPTEKPTPAVSTTAVTEFAPTTAQTPSPAASIPPAEPTAQTTPGAEEPPAASPSATAAVDPPAVPSVPAETLSPAAPSESAGDPQESATPLPGQETPAPSSTAAPVLTPAPSGEPVVSPVPARPTDEEVLSAYHQAEEAYRWFDLTTLPLDYTQTKLVGEAVYYPVSDERFPTMDALRGYLKTLFSDEIVDALLPLDGVHYLEIDGALCAMEADRGTDENSGTVIETVNWPQEGGDALCTVQVSVELLWEDENYPEGKRTYDFPYQKVGDKWVFTHFEPIM